MTRKVSGKRRESRSGFTLMEVAIAIVVLAVGVLSVFGLLGGGLDNSSKAVSDTQVAMFAESVLNGLRANSSKASEMGENAWYDYWANPTTSVVCAYAWGDGSGNAMPAIKETGANAETLVFTNHSFRASSADNIVNSALRYKLSVEEVDVGTTGVEIHNYYVTLKVWNGHFGRTDDKTAFIFYSEYSNLGTL